MIKNGHHFPLCRAMAPTRPRHPKNQVRVHCKLTGNGYVTQCTDRYLNPFETCRPHCVCECKWRSQVLVGIYAHIALLHSVYYDSRGGLETNNHHERSIVINKLDAIVCKQSITFTQHRAFNREEEEAAEEHSFPTRDIYPISDTK